MEVPTFAVLQIEHLFLTRQQLGVLVLEVDLAVQGLAKQFIKKIPEPMFTLMSSLGGGVGGRGGGTLSSKIGLNSAGRSTLLVHISSNSVEEISNGT